MDHPIFLEALALTIMARNQCADLLFAFTLSNHGSCLRDAINSKRCAQYKYVCMTAKGRIRLRGSHVVFHPARDSSSISQDTC